MKTLSPLCAVLALLLLAPAVHAINVSEPPDFPNSAAAVTAANTYTLTVGSNTFSGTTPFGTGDADFFKVVVPAGVRVRQIVLSTTPSGFNASFTVPPVPSNAGTYVAGFNPGQILQDVSWTIVFTVAAVPDFDVVSGSGVLTLTDNTNHGDTLTLSEPTNGTIKFAAPSRTFSVNNGAYTTGDTGSTGVSLSGITSVVVNDGTGSNTINVGAFTNSSFPGLTVNGGTGGADTVNFNGNITFTINDSLTVAATASSAGVVNVNNSAQLAASGSGAITIKCSQSVSVTGGAVLQTTGGNIDVEANQQMPSIVGNFTGVNLDGAGTAIKATGGGVVTVKGTGGNDPGGSQLGVHVVNGAKISSGSGAVLVIGAGGASAGGINRGVTVYGSGSAITSGSNGVAVNGTGGAAGNAYGIGVSVLYGGQISGAGTTTVNGTGAGASGSGANQGIEVAETGSLIISSGSLLVVGTAGPGSSTGVTVYHAAGITLASASNNSLTIFADSVSFADTGNVTTTAASSSVTFAPTGLATQIDLGGVSTTGVLGLADADLDHVSTPFLGINGGTGITISSPITRPTAGTVQLSATGAILATASGIDLSDGNGTVNLSATLACPITGAPADSGYPQLNIVGNINLNLVALDISASTFAGAAGNQFTIVKNSGFGTSTSSHFANLPEGAYLVWPPDSTLAAQITYVGGTGHDVVLTLVPVAQALTVKNTANDSSLGSLKTVLAFAAGHPGADTVTFDPSLNGTTITLTGPANDHAIYFTGSASVSIDASNLASGLTIQGAGASGNFGLLRIDHGASLNLRGLTLANGGGSNFHNGGGAIYNDGTVILTQCTLSGNSSIGGGGAIYNDVSLAVTQCTFNGNSNFDGNIGLGGAIFNYVNSSATVSQCTFFGNSAANKGGAIFNFVTSTATVSQCTLSGNSAVNSGGGINSDGTLSLVNSIVAGNTSPAGADIGNGSALILSGANIVQSLLGNAPTGSGTIVNADPLLVPLGSYGGPTNTMIPKPGSPAIDHGDNTQIPNDPATGLPFTTDQRGFARIQNNTVDVGAVETSAFQVINSLDDGSTGSLRQGVSQATDITTTITFAPGVAGPIQLAGGEIVLAKNFAIDASALPGGVVISGGGTSRIFTTNSLTTIVLTNLILTGGNGGGALVNGSAGAIYNNGAALTLNQCTVSNNAATGAGTGNSGIGGAIRNSASLSTGSLTLNRSTVANNAASTTTGSVVGGVACATIPTTLNQCTFTGNSTIGVGGALSVALGGSLAVNQSTIAGNHAGTAGGGVNNAGTATITNSIVATNTGSPGADINNNTGTVTRVGRNVIGDNTTVTTQFPVGSPNANGDYVGTTASPVDPLLAPLGSYGGPTQTMALLMGTPAHNAAVNSAFTTDQRGFAITDGHPDIGAYEAGDISNYNAWIYENLPASTANNAAVHATTYDYDGDGVTNFNEWIEQTNPGDSTSYLHITQTTFSSPTLTIAFPSVFGRHYSVEGATDLNNTWTIIDGPLTGTGSPISRSYILPVGSTPKYFLRVRGGP